MFAAHHINHPVIVIVLATLFVLAVIATLTKPPEL